MKGCPTIFQKQIWKKNIQYKKRIRLKNYDYTGYNCYFITICTRDKKHALKDAGLIAWLADILKEKAESFSFRIWAYCFMLDHLHLLIEGKAINSDMKKFISSYK